MLSADLVRLKAAFRDVPRPLVVEGDRQEIDMTTAEIERLLHADQDSLTAEDFSGYVGYPTTGGPDDLRYFLPAMLRIWRDELYVPDKGTDGWFVQYFHSELDQSGILDQHLAPEPRVAVIEFMRAAILERIAAEEVLVVRRPEDYPMWFDFVGAYAVLTDDLPNLWRQWWACKTVGHAIAVVHYAACLACDRLTDAIYRITLPDHVRSFRIAPKLWTADIVFGSERWRAPNVAFWEAILTREYLDERLSMAIRRLDGHPDRSAAAAVLDALRKRPELADHRCRAIAQLLRANTIPVTLGWEEIGEA